MFDAIVEAVSSSAWTYVIVFAVAAIDAFFPVVPSESTAIAAGVFAGAGDLSIELVIACAAAGAILGDNISYALGAQLGHPLRRRFFSGERGRKRIEWAERTIDERGGYLIVIARFIPGGRTAVTFTSGHVHTMSWPRFFAYDVLAGVLWAAYASLLGYLGGRTFEEEPWKGLVVAFAIAGGIALTVESYRYYRRRTA